jgi:1,4-alpha-glucan branching enzyme
VTNAVGNGIIYDPQAFDWGDTTFSMGTGNELVIYEMHIGTFNRVAGGISPPSPHTTWHAGPHQAVRGNHRAVAGH